MSANNEEVNTCELCKKYGIEKGDSLISSSLS